MPVFDSPETVDMGEKPGLNFPRSQILHQVKAGLFEVRCERHGIQAGEHRLARLTGPLD